MSVTLIEKESAEVEAKDIRRIDVSAALLISYITKHQLPVLEAFGRLIRHLRVLVSVEMEPQRDYQAEFGSLEVFIQKNITLRRQWFHRTGFADRLNVHIPYDTFWQLLRMRPKVVVSYELGTRSLMSALYRWIFPASRLVLCVNVSEHTEQSWGLLRRWIRPCLLKLADVVTYNGPSCARYLESIGVPNEKLVHFPYAAHPQTIHLGSPSRNEVDRRRLLYVGQLTERKNPLPFIEQLSCWAQANPERRVQLTIVGRGPLQSKIEALSLPNNFEISMVGVIDPRDMPNVWKNHGILVFPTLADEWGLVVDEALASGVPVLGSIFAQSVLTLVENDENGITFCPNDPKEMYVAIDRMLNKTHDELEAMAIYARRRVSDRTPENAAHSLLDAVRKAIGDTKSNPMREDSIRC